MTYLKILILHFGDMDILFGDMDILFAAHEKMNMCRYNDELKSFVRRCKLNSMHFGNEWR
jgi:hypothetical protein